MKSKKLLIDFRPGTSAFERNKLIRKVMIGINFQEIVNGVLIDELGNQSKDYFENRLIENAAKIEIYYW